MQDIYESIYKRYHSKDAYSSHYSSIHSIGNLELSIGFYDKLIEIRAMQKDQLVLSLSISKDSFGMWEPKPKITMGRERCLEILRENHPEIFEWCLWNL